MIDSHDFIDRNWLSVVQNKAFLHGGARQSVCVITKLKLYYITFDLIWIKGLFYKISSSLSISCF